MESIGHSSGQSLILWRLESKRFLLCHEFFNPLRNCVADPSQVCGKAYSLLSGSIGHFLWNHWWVSWITPLTFSLSKFCWRKNAHLVFSPQHGYCFDSITNLIKNGFIKLLIVILFSSIVWTSREGLLESGYNSLARCSMDFSVTEISIHDSRLTTNI
jgi:hypothetical protein